MLRLLLVSSLVVGACAIQGVLVSPDALAIGLSSTGFPDDGAMQVDADGSLVERHTQENCDVVCCEHIQFKGTPDSKESCKTFKQCQALCDPTSGCKGVSWEQTNGKCKLYSTEREKDKTKEIWSGSPSCELPTNREDDNDNGDLYPDNGCAGTAPTATSPAAEGSAPTEKADTEASTEAPTEASTEAPTKASTEAPTEASTEASAEASTEDPTEASTSQCHDNDDAGIVFRFPPFAEADRRLIHCEMIRNAEAGTGEWMDAARKPLDPEKYTFANLCKGNFDEKDTSQTHKANQYAREVLKACRKSCGCCSDDKPDEVCNLGSW